MRPPHALPQFVRYGASPKYQIVAFSTTTSVGAHPAEEAYTIIAQIWADATGPHFVLGQLDQNAEARFSVRSFHFSDTLKLEPGRGLRRGRAETVAADLAARWSYAAA